VTPKTAEELEIMRKGGKILAHLLSELSKMVKSDRSAEELELSARSFIRKSDAIPSFLDYKGYKYATTISVNEEIVHGLPTKDKIFKEGDLVGIDVGILYQGLHVDSAVTVGVGEIGEKEKTLLDVTKKALTNGIKTARAGTHLGDIQHAIQVTVEGAGFQVIRDLCGHGIGRNLQEDPQIPNFGEAGTGAILTEGVTVALEPMVTQESEEVVVMPDGWTVVALDGKPSAHFEHTIAITASGAEVLTR